MKTKPLFATAVSGVLATGILVILLPSKTVAAQQCGLDQIISGYQDGLSKSTSKDFEGAKASWRVLADAGFGPAQIRMAGLYEDGKGGERSTERAAFWATLAMRAGDKEAMATAPRLRGELSPSQRKQLAKRVGTWKPAHVSCIGGRFKTTAEYRPIQISDIVLTARGRNQKILMDAAKPQLVKVISHMESSVPGAGFYLRVIDGIEFYNAERYHRFIDWKQGTNKNILRFANSNFRDQSPKFLAERLIIAVKQRAYSRITDAEFLNPLVKYRGKTRLVGANYPDIRNEQFFKTINKAFDMGDRLPPELRRFITIVDEMRYNPPSKHFVRGGTLDASAGYYNKFLSSTDNRIIFFRRKVLFSSPIFFLRTIIHEGTHAVQDETADRYRHEIPRDDRKLKQLVSAGKGDSQEAARLKGEIRAKNNYLERWYRGVQKPQGWIQDIRFECEATINEIKALQALGGAPDMMRDSGYIRVCPDAQRMLVRWRDQRFKNRRRQ